MTVYRESFGADSTGYRPTYHQVTEQTREIVNRSGVKNGICVVSTHHTTCSVFTQEDAFDMTYTGLDYLQQDLTDVFEKIIPTTRKEGQYMHPGPLATKFANEHGESNAESLNTDAHLRSVFVGRSVTIQLVDGKLDLGSFGHIYFVDFDQTHPRKRQIDVMILGE